MQKKCLKEMLEPYNHVWKRNVELYLGVAVTVERPSSNQRSTPLHRMVKVSIEHQNIWKALNCAYIVDVMAKAFATVKGYEDPDGTGPKN